MKTWILEKWQTPEDMQETLDQLREIAGFMKTCGDLGEDEIKKSEQCIERQIQKMDANPDGYWLGFDGKSKYRDFCYVAKETMRRNRSATFRVVEAEIEDGAWTWMGYKNPVQNDKVLRYLYATL